MKNTTKVRSLSLLAVAGLGAALSLSACGGDSGGGNVASDCKPKVADIQTVQPGKVTVGVIDIPPFSSYNSGDPKGIDVDIVKKFAAENCLSPVWQQATYADAVQSISGSTIDMAVGTIDRTEARQKAVDFSSTTYLDGLGIVSKTGAKTIKDLEGAKSVGTIDGYLWVDDLRKILGDKLKTYPSSVELKADFDAGRLDVAVDAYGVAVPAYKDSSGVTVELANSNPDPRVEAIVKAPQAAFPLTKGNTSLNGAVSGTIDQLRKDGQIKTWLKDAGLSEDLAGTDKELAEVYSVPAK